MASQDYKPTVWRMALGEKGKYESDALENGLVFVGFGIEDDLEGKSEAHIKRLVDKLPGLTDGQKRSHASKLSMLTIRMQIGDLVVIYLKQQIGNLAVGRVVGNYKFDESRREIPHTREVHWIRPSTPITQDWESLLPYIRAQSTINPVKHEETIAKVLRVVEPSGEVDTSDVARDEEPEAQVAITQDASAQIATLIHQRFPGKEMERLVAGVLEAEGYTIGPLVGGADQGVDVLAGHGLLGFDPPLVCVQVKHEQGTTNAATVQQLRGAVEGFGAQQGLFVSWGGYTRDAEREARRSFFKVRLWYRSDLIEAVCRNYDKLSAELRAEIPLKQIWVVSDGDGF